MTTALEGGEGSASRPRRFTPRKDPVPIVQETGLQGRSGQVRKISPQPGIRSPDRPARSQSLYRLSYRPTRYNITPTDFVRIFLTCDYTTPRVSTAYQRTLATKTTADLHYDSVCI
jgi:hypothetical protein